MESLVTTDWLAGHLDDVRIADASWFLPEHARDAAAEFVEGHIPGAVFLDLKAFADPGNDLPIMLADDRHFAEQMGALGIAAGDAVVIYDDTPLHAAARAWWMLHTMGMRDVAILDGGLAAWKAEGRALETGRRAPAPAPFSATADRSGVRDLAAMRATVEQIVDARGPARFAGAEPEPRPGVVPGHIPGSINLPYTRLFDPDGRWKRGEALAAAFAEAGVDVDRPVATTCGSGVTAAALVFGLHLLGRDAALYDGSWSEWGARPDTLKATG